MQTIDQKLVCLLLNILKINKVFKNALFEKNIAYQVNNNLLYNFSKNNLFLKLIHANNMSLCALFFIFDSLKVCIITIKFDCNHNKGLFYYYNQIHVRI